METLGSYYLTLICNASVSTCFYSSKPRDFCLISYSIHIGLLNAVPWIFVQQITQFFSKNVDTVDKSFLYSHFTIDKGEMYENKFSIMLFKCFEK